MRAVSTEVSGHVATLLDVRDDRGRVMAWTKVGRGGEYYLVDTKRSCTNYPNRVGEEEAVFFLDNRDNVVNRLLLSQAEVEEEARKVPFRIVQHVATGSTSTVDRGCFVVVGVEPGRRSVTLRRRVDAPPLPTGRGYKHASEEKAHSFLSSLFPSPGWDVRQEAATLNLSEEGIVGRDGRAVNYYTVDFTVRRRDGGPAVAWEVKKCRATWDACSGVAAAKVLAWERTIGTPCYVLLVEPSVSIHRVVDGRLASGPAADERPCFFEEEGPKADLSPPILPEAISRELDPGAD